MWHVQIHGDTDDGRIQLRLIQHFTEIGVCLIGLEKVFGRFKLILSNIAHRMHANPAVSQSSAQRATPSSDSHNANIDFFEHRYSPVLRI